ncbi:MAG: mycothione reductase, partial [Acidimicrobiia bacterium]|nr:mycothione reductase [Acidimicrobiia bacterium]
MHSFDLIIIGTGSGNSILTPDFDGWNVAMVERDVFGGTCLNRGCIPSKMFVYAADQVEHARHADKLGVDLSVDGVRWAEIVERVFGRIDPIAQGGEDYRVGLDNVTVFRGDARFTGPKILQIGDVELTAPQIVLAAGARPFIPPVPGLDDVGYYTSDNIMRVDAPPPRLVIMGGGYIAAEMAHVFDGLGSSVTLVNRTSRLLRFEDDDISARFTEIASKRFEVTLDAAVDRCSTDDDGIRIDLTVEGSPSTVHADAILVATGRIPNGAQLGVETAGVTLDDDGYVITDAALETNVSGIWALGDIVNPDQLKHTANAEARVVSHNLVHPDERVEVDLDPTPHAIFGSPQIAGVGVTEHELIESGRAYRRSIQPYGATAYGWAMEDETGFCKVLADPATRLLLGAHIIGPQASTLIQQLIQGMKFGLTVDQMATQQLYIHP